MQEYWYWTRQSRVPIRICDPINSCKILVVYVNNTKLKFHPVLIIDYLILSNIAEMKCQERNLHYDIYYLLRQRQPTKLPEIRSMKTHIDQY